MSDDSDRILQTYMETLLRLQRDRERDSLSQEELRQIAIDSGMTEADMKFVHQRFVDYLNRGQGFLKYENWDGAINELEQAAALEPNNVVALNALAAAHWSRSSRSGEAGVDLERARGYAGRVLRIDSANDPALRLMSAIQKGERPTEKKKYEPGKASRMIVLAAFIIALAGIVLLGTRMSDNKISRESIVDTVIVEREAPPAGTPRLPDVVAKEPKAADTGIARLVRSYGEEGIGPGMMTDARSIALDGAGRTYIAEYSDGRVQAFDSTGRYLHQWNIGTKRPLLALAADRNSKVYIVSSGKILRYDGATGEDLGAVSYAGGNNFTDVTVAADGSLVTAWDGHSGGGLLVNPKSKDNIVIFDQNGKVKRTLKNAVSSASDNFEMDIELATDGLGGIYALGRMALFKFSPEGKFLTRLAGKGDKPGQFGWAQELAIDGQGRIYLCDFKGVLVYDKDGLYIGMIDLPGAASGVAIDDHNGIHIVARTKVYQYALR